MTIPIVFIGFGEAAATFACADGWSGSTTAYDKDPARRAVMESAKVAVADHPGDALGNAALVLSLVTADQALDVAREYAPFLHHEAIWCDMNSVAPETKRQAAALIDRAGGRYVDAAILAPVSPARMAVPLLLAGEAAPDAQIALANAGFRDIRVVGPDVGRASAIKMIRSVMVKGIEALTYEMMAAARSADVVDEVLSSLDRSEKSDSWSARAAYNLERMATHGLRRAAEMEESASTLSALGVEPVMTQATMCRQRDAAGSALSKRNAA